LCSEVPIPWHTIYFNFLLAVQAKPLIKIFLFCFCDFLYFYLALLLFNFL